MPKISPYDESGGYSLSYSPPQKTTKVPSSVSPHDESGGYDLGGGGGDGGGGASVSEAMRSYTPPPNRPLRNAGALYAPQKPVGVGLLDQDILFPSKRSPTQEQQASARYVAGQFAPQMQLGRLITGLPGVEPTRRAAAVLSLGANRAQGGRGMLTPVQAQQALLAPYSRRTLGDIPTLPPDVAASAIEQVYGPGSLTPTMSSANTPVEQRMGVGQPQSQFVQFATPEDAQEAVNLGLHAQEYYALTEVAASLPPAQQARLLNAIDDIEARNAGNPRQAREEVLATVDSYLR